MSVFRIQKKSNYTVMSNYHLRDKNLSLKAIGLMCKMLSLTDDWDYTTRGLASICKEGVDAIGAALRELEAAGYLVRKQLRDSKGRITDTEYTLYEYPQNAQNPHDDEPKSDEITPDSTSSDMSAPYAEITDTGSAHMEKPAQLNKDILNTNLSSTYISNPYQSIPRAREIEPMDMQIDVMGYDEATETVKENIDYDIIRSIYPIDRLDEIVDIASEALCSRRTTFKFGGDTYPYALVKDRLLKLDSSHIDYVISCIDSSTTEIRNIKQYLLKTLINAPATMASYYTAKVNHDLYGDSRKE